jgi:hypothetical protein
MGVSEIYINTKTDNERRKQQDNPIQVSATVAYRGDRGRALPGDSCSGDAAAAAATTGTRARACSNCLTFTCSSVRGMGLGTGKHAWSRGRTVVVGTEEADGFEHVGCAKLRVRPMGIISLIEMGL